MQRNYVLLSTIMITILLSSCSKEIAYKPREINPDIDICTICNMSVAHIDHATEVILDNGEILTFDDIGCMIEYIERSEENTTAINKSYVRDIKSNEWIELQDAHFAYHQEFWTPMAYGVISFATKQQAETYIEEEKKGELLEYVDLLNHNWDGF
ncbi:nitrous oxide reductase accessory protein NosL [Cytobacillus sp. IB215665]|uniref:nitrous oxide reductase accessory protein NosL n=1 Tax=Cytobacillus sp. IB215665 TaxID=3097357 RepID=UPI002A15F317|nr:nitrous oxide reductase accessory protein NosL [Cytobacillus sp. IB215665]MDX8367419.1 nitrous oxide reductase accessory protein NosL [Cytobacillus sp. IB215665]